MGARHLANVGRPVRLATLAAPDPAAVVVLLLVLLVLVPLLPGGLPVTSDGALHFYRLVEYDAALRAGIWYPRWAGHLWYGYGYPVFNYYAPLWYALAAGIHALGSDLESAVKLSQGVAVALAAAGAYRLARLWAPAEAALVAAVAYPLLPHFLTEGYRRADYPQLLATALLPWLWWAYLRLHRGATSGKVALAAVAYAAVLFSHNVTALLFTPLFAATLLALAARTWREAGGERWRALWCWVAGAGAALGLAAALTAVFWLPALLELDAIQKERLVRQYVVYDNLVPLPDLLRPSLPVDLAMGNPPAVYNLGWGHLLVGMVGLGLAATERRLRPAALGWSLLAVISVLLMLPSAAPVWTYMPGWVLTQVPWRFLAPAGLGLAALGAVGLGRLPPRLRAAASAVAALALLVTSLPALHPPRPFARLDPSPEGIYRFERTTGAVGTTSDREYLPVWATRPPRSGDRPASPTLASVPVGVAVEAEWWQPGRIGLRVRAAANTVLPLAVLYFPGWQATLDGVPLELAPLPGSGLASAVVPAGEHTVELWFADTPLRQAAAALSWLGLLALAALSARVLLGRRRISAVPGRSNVAPPAEGAVARSRPGLDAPHGTGRAAPSVGGWLVAGAIAAVLALKVLVLDPTPGVTYVASPRGVVPPAQRKLHITFDGVMHLVGYSLSAERLRAGETLSLTLYWQLWEPAPREYNVSAQLLRARDLANIAKTTHDHPGLSLPVTRWQVGKYYADVHELRLPEDAEPGRYRIEVSMRGRRLGRRAVADPDTGARTGPGAYLGDVEVVP